jgi:hypothetical protein
MPASLPTYDFENFPRGELCEPISRRQFFEGLITELRARAKKHETGQVFKLSSLGEMEDGQLAWVIPVQLPGAQVWVEAGFVWGRPTPREEPVRLFPGGSPAEQVWGRADGTRSIADLSRQLARDQQWQKTHAFAYTRGVFLWLVQARLFIPKDAKSERRT